MATPSQGPSGQAVPPESKDTLQPKPVFLEKIHWRSVDPDLRYKFWALVGQYSSLAFTVLGFIVLIISINSNTKSLGLTLESLRMNGQSLRLNVQNTVLTHVVNLDRFFIERPHLYPYFYEGKSIGPQDRYYGEALAGAQMIADILDLVSEQSHKFPDQWDDVAAWDTWISDSLKGSPILVKFLRDHSQWYSDDIMKRVKEMKR